MRKPFALLLPFLLSACAAVATSFPPETRWRTVLVAGDASLPVWDNAVQQLAGRLAPLTAGPVRRLSADPALAGRSVTPATLQNTLAAIGTLNPGAGEGCLVFATAHGVPRAGLVLAAQREVLSPAALDFALEKGCGDAPTVVIISACFSGSFAEAPMQRPNRVILTAARPDRSSFGCGAGFTYTVFDECLLGALGTGTWRDIAGRTRACVEQREAAMRLTPPSGPQFFEGASVSGLRARFGS